MVDLEKQGVLTQRDKTPKKSRMAKPKSTKRINRKEAYLRDLEETNRRLKLQFQQATLRHDKLKSMLEIATVKKVISEEFQRILDMPLYESDTFDLTKDSKTSPNCPLACIVKSEGQDQSHSEPMKRITSPETSSATGGLQGDENQSSASGH